MVVIEEEGKKSSLSVVSKKEESENSVKEVGATTPYEIKNIDRPASPKTDEIPKPDVDIKDVVPEKKPLIVEPSIVDQSDYKAADQ